MKCSVAWCNNAAVYTANTRGGLKNLCKDHCFETKCKVCGKQFYTTAKNSGACSEECRKKRGYTKKPVISGTCICKYCGKEFEKESTKSGQKYCSKECSRLAITATQRWRFIIFERDNFTCFYCGKISYIDKVELHVDHVIPKSRGGNDIASNLVTACHLCNLSKWASEIRNIGPIL